MNSIFAAQIMVAVGFDLLFGDPRWLPHPVRFIGLLCTRFERFFRYLIISPFIAGTLTVAAVIAVTVSLTALILYSTALIYSDLAQGIAVLLLYLSLAARDLTVHSRRVYAALENNTTLAEAREAVSCIVGRDTANLDRSGIIRACVETVAENMVDGVTAPIFYALSGSMLAPVTGVNPIVLAAIGAMCYKAVNTMDSMFGYKNEQYILFGRSAARLDDAVNFLPARISGLCLVAAAFFLRMDWKKSYIIMRRDRLNHASPNAAHPEAVVAGALGVQLGGVSVYFGEMVRKPVIGESLREIESDDILRTNALMLLGSFVFLFFMLILRTVFL